VRKHFVILFAVLALGGTGCGKDAASGPPSLTPEQIEAADGEQKKVEGEEKAHQKAGRGDKKGSGNSVDEEERRARGAR
jgi:hypothetical protein